jgi:hypothetical protein
MKKIKVILVLVLLGVATGGAFAQVWDRYAPGIDSSKVLINAGVGFGLLLSGYDLGLPPISVAADFKLPAKVPITLGGLFAISSRSYTYDYSYYSVTRGYKFTYTDIGFGLRGMYHVNFAKNLDTYAGLTLGYVISTSKTEYTGTWGTTDKSEPIDYSYFLYGFNVGLRYFFTNNIGAYLEVGYSGLQIASLGLSLKF